MDSPKFQEFLRFACGELWPPSEVRSSGIPNVTKVSCKRLVRPSAPDSDLCTIGHEEYLSTITTYSVLLKEK